MSTGHDLAYINRLAWALLVNESPEVRALAKKLELLTSMFIYWHQPPFFKVFEVGYTCLDEPDQHERLLFMLRRLKAILPSGPTLHNGKVFEQKTYRLRKFSSENLAEMDSLMLALGVLLMEERLTAYVPYCLGKIKKLPEWRNSPFFKMSWQDINSAVANSNQAVIDLINHIAKSHNYDSAVIMQWIRFRASAVTKDFYISRTVQDLKMSKLTNRVWSDQDHLELIHKDDSDLTTKSLCLAFWTFRNEWFESIQSETRFSFTKMAQKWLGQQNLLRGNIEVANYYLRHASDSAEESSEEKPYLLECRSE